MMLADELTGLGTADRTGSTAMILAWHKPERGQPPACRYSRRRTDHARALVATVADAAAVPLGTGLRGLPRLGPASRTAAGARSGWDGSPSMGIAYLSKLLVIGATAVIRHGSGRGSTASGAWINEPVGTRVRRGWSAWRWPIRPPASPGRCWRNQNATASPPLRLADLLCRPERNAIARVMML